MQSRLLITLTLAAMFPSFLHAGAIKIQSHPPRRPLTIDLKRPVATGPALYVDGGKGDDASDGSKAKPWRTLKHAVARARAGDTIYLHGGVYHEHVAIRQHGRPDAPITVRSLPGEQVVIDGGLPDFFESPATAWEPISKNGEYRSKQTYPNIRDVMGAFGDSMVGLHTYHHAIDLRADNEFWDWENPSELKTTDIKPVYCGPGLWYNRETGHIHVRLAHTHLEDIVNYRGETDPRMLPLIVAPFRSVPLALDGARHIRLQDMSIRGGGYNTVILSQCTDVVFDNVTVWSSTYGLRILGTQQLKLLNCGFYGSVPPWTFRTDTSLRSYPGRPHRDITRFGTHALLIPEAGREFEVFAFPINDDWEIARCEFTDGHDGIYLGAVNVRFHHNHLHDLQDDGIYLSPMYSRIGRSKAELHVYQNVIGRSLTALAFGGSEKLNEDNVFIYRNVVELLEPLQTGRPSAKDPKPRFSFGHVMGDHGSPPWSAMQIYHNTFVMHDARFSDMGLTGAAAPERPRRVFNNILLHLGKFPAFHSTGKETALALDGNLYWSPNLDKEKAAAFFAKFRASGAFEKSKASYEAGFEAKAQVSDPRFARFAEQPRTPNDYALPKDSSAVNAGVALPTEWPDPLRKMDDGLLDVGALPAGMKSEPVGRAAN